jgi:uncharacterized surface protein with fasciclin (FAS1) repeats
MRNSRRIAITLLAASSVALGATVATPTWAQMKDEKTVTVGGAPMYPSKTIVENAVNSKDHTTLVTAVKAAGLVETLSGPGPFTVFAPTNAAFAKLPKDTVENLLKPENKEQLKKVLTYHVVSGRMSAKDLMDAAKKAGGKAMIKTVDGADLIVEAKGSDLMIGDTKGDMAKVTIDNVFQSNGVIHVIDTVLLPG